MDGLKAEVSKGGPKAGAHVKMTVPMWRMSVATWIACAMSYVCPDRWKSSITLFLAKWVASGMRLVK